MTELTKRDRVDRMQRAGFTMAETAMIANMPINTVKSYWCVKSDQAPPRSKIDNVLVRVFRKVFGYDPIRDEVFK